MNITIDNQEFELVELWQDEQGTVTPFKGVHARRIAFAMEPVETSGSKEYRLIFRAADEPTGDLLFDKTEYTPKQAEALAEALQAWIHYVKNPTDTSGKVPSYEKDMNRAIGLSVAARMARRTK